MSYLLDKKLQRKKFLTTFLLVFFLFLVFYFRGPILKNLSSVSHFVFRPVFYVGNNISESLSNMRVYFAFKSSLLEDKQNLANTLDEKMALYSNYMSVLDENNKMKEILNRKNSKMSMTLAGILSKPSQSLYDTLIIDAGVSEGVSVGARVFAFGSVPIGRVAETYENSSKVILFSSPGEKTEVVVRSKDIFMQLIGRGGGNFEMASMKDLILEKGTEVLLPGINSYVVATVEKNISDPRDSFDKLLLISPVNIQELKFVQVEK
jgi:cell shape-determining protein MreC